MNIKKPRGTKDIYYEKAEELNILEYMLRSFVDKYNYHEIKTPIFESKYLFIYSIGPKTDIINKEMFKLLNNKKKYEFVLRPEGTASVIRSIIENKLYKKYELPLKLFYLGSMFRYERPQYGRFREFNQFGIEVIGVKNYLLDIEVILLGFNFLKKIGLKKLILKLNYLTIDKYREKYIYVLKNFFKQKTLCLNCQIRIKNNPLRVLDCKIDQIKFDKAPKIYDYLTENEKNEFKKLQNFLVKLRIPFILDHKLVRGLDYYTGIVFEILIDEKDNELTIIGGGRYDKLINIFEPSLNYPAVGFALGIERLLLFLNKEKIILFNKKKLDAYIICLSEHAQLFSVSVLILLRENGFYVDYNYSFKNIKSQFKTLKRLKANNAIIIGNQEFKKNVIKIKNQKSGKELEIKFENIISFLSNEGNK